MGWLADVAEGLASARTLAVVGARGGVGASTFAATLAVRAARRAPTFLLDADPSGGGVELVIGSEHVDGLRWPDVALTDGRITASTLRGALPEHRGVTVLSWSRGPVATVAAATMQSMVAAAARSFRHIVVDLPRTLDAAAGAACRRPTSSYSSAPTTCDPWPARAPCCRRSVRREPTSGSW